MSKWSSPFALGGFNDQRDNAELKSMIGGRSKASKTGKGSSMAKSSKTKDGKSGGRTRYEDLPANKEKMQAEIKALKEKQKEKKNVNWREKHKEQLQKKFERQSASDHGVVRGGYVEFGRQGDMDSDDDDMSGSNSRHADIRKNVKEAKSEAAKATELDLARFNDDDDEDQPTTASSTSTKKSGSGITEAALRMAEAARLQEMREAREAKDSKKKKNKKAKKTPDEDSDVDDDFEFGGEVIKYRDDESDEDVDFDDDRDNNASGDDAEASEDDTNEQADTFDEEPEHKHEGLKLKKMKKNGGFESMNLLPEVYQGVRKMGYRVPTPIQRKAIPVLIEGRDVVAMARTGSGKTAAFTIPILNRLQSHNYLPPGVVEDRQSRVGPQWCRAVVLSPTRELAMQTHKVIYQLGRFLDLRYCLLVGGQQMEVQFSHLTNCPDIIIATPGRLVHHLIEIKFELSNVEVMVFDEADRMFELGFATQIHEIQRRTNPHHLTWLFSATMPKALAEFSRAGLKQPVTIRLDSESKLSPDLSVSFFSTRTQDRLGLLQYLLTEIIPEKEQLMIFAATKLVVEFIEAALKGAGHAVTAVHGTMDSEVRNVNVEAFRAREVRVMVVTDVAARGIDIPLLDNVLNFDFPSKAKLFVHRCGRVARAGRPGLAMSFVTPQEVPYLLDVYIFFGWPLKQFISKETEFSATLADREILEQAKRASEGKNERDKANRVVEIGRPPFQMIESQIRFMAEKCEELYLEDMERAAMNSYKLYRKTRDAASVASAKLWKEMETLGFHPVFYRQEQARLDKLRAAGVTTTTDITTLSQLEEMDQALQSLARFTPRETVFEMMHADEEGFMKRKRAIHDATIKQDKAHRQAIAELLENRAENRAMQRDVKFDDPEARSNSSELPRKGELAKKIATAATESKTTQAVSQASKPRITAAMRRAMKKKSGSESAPVSIEELTREAAEAGGLEITGGTMSTTRVKRGKLTTEQRKDAMYISTLPTENYIEELGLSIHGGDAFNVELTADTSEGIQERKRVKVWDARKKDFKIEYNNKNPFGQLKNESGAKISGGKAAKIVPGELYEKWVQNGRQNPRKVAQAETFSEGYESKGPVRSEIKTRDQIIKARKTAEWNKAKYSRSAKK